MAHFAKLDDNNIVIAVHVVNNDIITIDGIESEQAGIDFLTDLHGHSNWKQTSYNGNTRGKYAGIGDTYRGDLDVFLEPQPFPSWTLDEVNKCWKAPIEQPAGISTYWDEETLSWLETPSTN